MTSKEIERLLAKSEKSIRWELLLVPLIGWFSSLISLSAALFLISSETLIFSLLLIFFSLVSSFGYRTRWGEVKNRRADLIWNHLKETAFYRFNDVTTELVKDIASLYHCDPRGEILPLPQAIRLVDIHHKQQKRLEIVIARLGALQYIGSALRDKTKQLRDLGESHEQGESRLQTLREDEAALDSMREQIRVSCHRLEMILIETRKAQQMRQLHREISALTLEKPGSDASQLHLAPDDALSDIERQITREVETFLRLERETDRHLREI